MAAFAGNRLSMQSSDYDDGNVVIKQEISLHVHERTYDAEHNRLETMIKGWKNAKKRPSDKEYNAALNTLHIMKGQHKELKDKADKLIQDLENLRNELKDEVDARIQQNTDLNAKIDELTRERDELRKVMLVRQLATATQFALTEQFPGAFVKTKFRYSCTFDNIKARVLKTGDVNHEAKLKEVIAMFEASGIDETDISEQLKVIREIGTTTSHPTTMIASDKTEYVPTPEQLLELIGDTNLPEDIKDTAKTLVGILQQLHPAGTLNILVTAK